MRLIDLFPDFGAVDGGFARCVESQPAWRLQSIVAPVRAKHHSGINLIFAGEFHERNFPLKWTVKERHYAVGSNLRTPTMHAAVHLLIATLIAQLGHDDFKTRELAHAALRGLGPLPIAQLQVAEKSSCCEQACRARQLVDRWYWDNAPAMAARMLGDGTVPWISDLADEREHGAANEYLLLARKGIGVHGQPDWQDYRFATRLLIESMCSRRATEAEVRAVLVELANAERAWVANYGGQFDPRPVAAADLPR